MNNRIIYIATSLVLIATALTSCDKTPMNGVLDGMWQLEQVRVGTATAERRDSLVFVSFQLHLTQWDKKNTSQRYYAHFEHTGDSIRFYDFAAAAKHDLSEGDNDTWLTPAQMSDGIMDEWGIHTTDARYRVIELNHQQLVLQAQDTTLTFRKF